MACEAPGGCSVASFTSNAPPELGDDACDTNDNGVYLCVGSYWIYDPTLPGADTATHGDCLRVWIQSSEECGMASWIELSTPSVIEDTVDPTDGVDCCPPSTIWHNTVTGTFFLSLNINCSCIWCPICSTVEDPHTSHYEQAPEQLTIYRDDDGTLPGADTDNINVQLVTFTNPSAVRSMSVCASWGGANADFSFLDDDGGFNARYAVQPEFSARIVPAAFTILNDRFQSDAYFAHFQGLGGRLGTTFEINMGTGGWNYCITLPPGATAEFRQEMFLNVLTPSTASEDTRISIYSLPITVHGTTI